MHLGDMVWQCVEALPKAAAKIQSHFPVHPHVSMPHGVREFARHVIHRVAVKVPVLAGTTCRYVAVGTAIVVASGPTSLIPSDLASSTRNSAGSVNANQWDDERGDCLGDSYPAIRLGGMSGNVAGSDLNRHALEIAPPISVVSEPTLLVLLGVGSAGILLLRGFRRLRRVVAEPPVLRHPE
jgi:hypothetical protein